jgi:ABC-type transporter Mla subunit MlaD
MSNLVAIVRAGVSREPARLDPATARALYSAACDASSGAIREEKLPAPLRAVLERRRDDLILALRPASRDRIAAALATLDGMVARAVNDFAEDRYSVQVDIADLADVAEWALEAAAADFRRAKVGEGRFRPTAGELRREAMRHAQPFAEELGRIERVLRAPVEPAAKPIDPDRRRALAAEMRAAVAAASMPDGPTP